VVERVLAKSGLRLQAFASMDEAVRALVPGNSLDLSGLILDEAQDVHAAYDGWTRIAAQRVLNGQGWAILLADKQLHQRYSAFDKALCKPFLPEDLERALAALINRGGAAVAPATPAMAAPAGPESWPTVLGPDANSTVRFDGKTCLVVDDNTVNQLVISELMQDFGFTITTASDGRKALTAAQEQKFDIILMDCRMPNMDGYDATRNLRQMMKAGTVPHTPIVALTANAMKGDSEKCLACGMDAFLSKPVRVPELIDVLVCLLPLTDDASSGDVMWLDAADTPPAPAPAPVAPTPAAPVFAAQPALTAGGSDTAPVFATQPAPRPSRRRRWPHLRPRRSLPRSLPWRLSRRRPHRRRCSPGSLRSSRLPSSLSRKRLPCRPLPFAQQPPLDMTEAMALPPWLRRLRLLRRSLSSPRWPLRRRAPRCRRSCLRPLPHRWPSLLRPRHRHSLRPPGHRPASRSSTRPPSRPCAPPCAASRSSSSSIAPIRSITSTRSRRRWRWAKEEAVLPAHTIKSSSKIVGATGMAALAEVMEKRLRTGQGDSIGEMTELHARMKAAYAQTLLCIDMLLARQSGSPRHRARRVASLRPGPSRPDG
jgi:CheY-like chemotaxis protein